MDINLNAINSGSEDGPFAQAMEDAIGGTSIGALMKAEEFGLSELGAMASIIVDPKEAVVEVLSAGLDVLFAEATAGLGAMFMAPAAQVGTAIACGLAHAHAKAPLVPLPSVGPVTFGCSSVLVKYIPTVRAGDWGVAFTCGGIPPFFQVATGSSKVFIGGARAARMGDFTAHCAGAKKEAEKPQSLAEVGGALAEAADEAINERVEHLVGSCKAVLEGAAGMIGSHVASEEAAASSRSKALLKRSLANARLVRARASVTGDASNDAEVLAEEYLGHSIAMSEVESHEANARGEELQGSVSMVQKAMDAGAGVFEALAGADPAIGPSIGAIVFGWPFVMVGGFQTPSSKFVVEGLGKIGSKIGKSAYSRLRNVRSASDLRKLAQGTFSPARLKESIATPLRFITGDPVDAITGAVVTDAVDATLRGGWPLDFVRHYSSAWSERDSALGFGWSASIDQALWLERGQVVVRIEDGRELCFEHEDGIDPRRQGLVLGLPVEALRLRSGGDGRWELLGGDGVRRTFAPIAGDAEPLRGIARLMRMEGPEGFALTFEYDDDARIRAVYGPGGRRLGVRRDPQGRIVALTLPRPEGPGEAVVARYDYSIAGDLIAVTDACGGTERFVYDDHRLVEQVRADGQRFFFTYDGPGSEGRCVRAFGEGEVHVRDFVYNTERRMTVVTHGSGEVLVVHADGWGRLTQVDDARGGSRRFEYDAIGRRVAIVDPLGQARRFEYDEVGRLTREIDADGAARSLEYDANGRVVAAVDALGGRTRNLFDEAGRLAAVIDAQGATTELRTEGRATIRRDAEGHEARIERDEHGLCTRIEAPTGACWRITYDRRGRPIELLGPGGEDERRRYDACDRLVAIDRGEGEARSYSRDASGRITAIHGGDGTIAAIERAYHPSRALLSRRDGHGLVTYARGSDGDLLGLTRGDGATHALTRDPRGAVIGERTFDGRSLAYERDLGDRITAVIQASGARTEYVHDAVGRVTEVRHADGVRERFRARGDGHLIAATREEDGAAITALIERDRLGRVVREVQDAGWVAAEYDRCGRRRRLQSSAGLALTIDRDGEGRPRTITVEQGGRRWQVEITRDRAGAEVERALPGEVSAVWERDALGRPCARTIVGPLGAPSSWDQSLGRPRGVIGARTHAWSGARSLRTVVEDGVRLLDRDAPARVDATADADADATDDRVTHVRDADGRVIERVHPDGQVDRLRWDASHRLREVITAAGERVRYDYDALGRRIRRRAGDETTTWLWDGDLPLHEVTQGPGGMSFRTWLFDPESWTPLAVVIGGGEGATRMVSVISDLVGAPMMAVDERGAVVWRGAPDRRGAAITAREGAQIDLPLQFPGQFADPVTGLHDNRHRVYDPAAGSYLSADPVGLAGGLQPHAYVDDPWTMIDPLGQAQRSVLDDDGPQPGATAYQPPRPPAVDALLDGDEPSTTVKAVTGFVATAAVTGVVLGAHWAARRCSK